MAIQNRNEGIIQKELSPQEVDYFLLNHLKNCEQDFLIELYENLERFNPLQNNQISSKPLLSDPKALISFNQALLCEEVLKSLVKRKYETLHNMQIQCDGFCELICNYVLLNDVLGTTSDKKQVDAYTKKSFNYAESTGLITIQKKKPLGGLSLFELDKVKNTHVIYISSLWQKLIAYIFDVPPYNLFSFFDKVQRNQEVNREVFDPKCASLDVGSYIKYSVYIKQAFSFQGHSLLIKKTGEDNYSFFDPNHGEYPNLNINELAEKINLTMKEHKATHMAFIDGKKYKQELELENKVTSSSPQSKLGS